MTLGSLFDGSGTAPLCATLLGWEPLWASEIEPYPIAVTKARFPKMQHLGSITEINGAEVPPVDVIVGGSPCQDLSVAGKQAGLQDGTRSNLFYEMTRVIREMRSATDGKYPRFVVWENVPGAFSSNKGRDFLAVVEAFCALTDDSVHIPRPAEDTKTGRLTWKTAGAIVGDGWSFAWRVLDAQYWGVPQRRHRIFAVLDLGSECAGEILFERAGLPWDSEPRGETRESAAADAVGRADRGGGVKCLNPWDCQSKRIFEVDGIYPTLPAMDGGGANNQAVIYPVGAVGSLCARADSSPCIDRGQPFVAMFSGGQGDKAGGIGYSEKAAPTLKSTPSGGNTVPDVVYSIEGNTVDRISNKNGCGYAQGVAPTLNTQDKHAVCFSNRPFNAGDTSDVVKTLCAQEASKQPGITVCYDARGNGDGVVTPTITGDHQNRVTDYTAICIGNGQLNQISMSEKSNALDCMHDKQAVLTNGRPPRKYIVRRLTPNECARLQGFPDWWTDGVEGSDSAKYKMWGNGMALPCMLAVLRGVGELERLTRRACPTCAHHLGAGQCAINLELECGKGGFEAWQAKTKP